MCKVRKLINQGYFVDGQEFKFRKKHVNSSIEESWYVSKSAWRTNKSSCFFHNDYVYYDLEEVDAIDFGGEFGIQKKAHSFYDDPSVFSSNEYDFLDD